MAEREVSTQLHNFMNEGLNPYFCDGCGTDHAPGNHRTLDDVEKEYILRIYESTGRNKVHTAGILNIARSGLYRKLEVYGVAK